MRVADRSTAHCVRNTVVVLFTDFAHSFAWTLTKATYLQPLSCQCQWLISNFGRLAWLNMIRYDWLTSLIFLIWRIDWLDCEWVTLSDVTLTDLCDLVWLATLIDRYSSLIWWTWLYHYCINRYNCYFTDCSVLFRFTKWPDLTWLTDSTHSINLIEWLELLICFFGITLSVLLNSLDCYYRLYWLDCKTVSVFSVTWWNTKLWQRTVLTSCLNLLFSEYWRFFFCGYKAVKLKTYLNVVLG